MTSETAGPSAEATAAELQKASQAYEEGMQHLKHEKLDTAVELLGKALHIRIKAHGDLSPECALYYQRYGEALFQKAQSESDVFGASLQKASRNRQQDEEEAAEEAEEEVHDKAQHDEKENVDAKGKAPMPEGEDIGEEEPVLEDGNEDEDGEEGDESDSDDMKLAWEMLEVARTICPKDKPLQLADVLLLLGDVAMETERFESAMTDYEQALGLLKAHLQADDRRIAEAHYKLSLTLHFLDNAEDALKHARAAVAVCNARIAHLAPAAAAAAPADAAAAAEAAADAVADAPAAEDAALAAQREVADLKGVLSDLAVKVEELEGAVRENESTRNALKAAFSRLAAVQAPAGSGGSGSSSAATGGSQQAAAHGGVINLGVVGRGSKRINLQPVSAAAAPSTDGATPKPKRSLEDMMGSGAATSIGFGAPVSIPAGFGAGSSGAAATALQLPGSLAKKPKQELQERIDNAQAAAGAPATVKPAALPAFLQSSTVAAVYGTGQQPIADNQRRAAAQNTQEAGAEG